MIRKLFVAFEFVMRNGDKINRLFLLGIRWRGGGCFLSGAGGAAADVGWHRLGRALAGVLGSWRK